MIPERESAQPHVIAPTPGVLAARPLYQQARDLLLQRIIDGVWKPGEYLPSELRLADELGVSVGTVRKAAEDLVEQGRLERLHGRGTRVTAHSSPSIRFRFLRFVHPDGRPFKPVGRLLDQSVQRASPVVAQALELVPRAKVLTLLRQRSEAGEVLVAENIALRAAPFERLRLQLGADMAEELYVLYQERCGVTIVRTQDQASFEIPDERISRLVGTKPGTAMLRIRRIAYALDGLPTELRDSWTQKLNYRIDLD